MNCHGLKFALSLLILIALTGAAAQAQTDIGASLYGAFSGAAVTNNGLKESPSDSAGGMVELRRIRSPLVGYEATYSFNRADQMYTSVIGCTLCTHNPTVAVSANAHEIAGDWLISARSRSLRPFLLAGAGILLAEPTSGQSGTQGFHTAVYVYGVGCDWRVRSYLGLRFQYRGSVYKAPFLSTDYSPSPGTGSPDVFKQNAEPMIGAYFKF